MAHGDHDGNDGDHDGNGDGKKKPTDLEPYPPPLSTLGAVVLRRLEGGRTREGGRRGGRRQIHRTTSLGQDP